MTARAMPVAPSPTSWPEHLPALVVRDGELRPVPDLAAAHDPATALSGCTGQFALHVRDAGGAHVLARDPLGVHKLFWALDGDGGVVSSHRWIELLRAGIAPGEVWSVPSGHCATVDPLRGSYDLRRWMDLPYGGDDRPDDLAAAIRDRLDHLFAGLAPVLAGRPVYVALSGGLDSSTIAAMAHRHLGGFTAVTFAIVPDAGSDPLAAAEGTDMATALRVAEHMGVELLAVPATPPEIVASVDDVLVHGQDWRDFNVHCALVNDAIGRAVSARHPGGGPRPVLLTGDTMNELMADYTPVRYGGHEYYALPRLSPGRLRRFLVGGLDAGDREVGVLAHHGIDVIQPYAICADVYARVPAPMLTDPRAKQQLAYEVMGDLVPDFVYQRKKVRAQEGGDIVGGTLAVLADAGLDQERLAARFCRLYGLDRTQLDRMVRLGLYRFPTSFPSPDPGEGPDESKGSTP